MEAKDVDSDATINLVTYREYGQSFILDVRTSKTCVCRRIFMTGVVERGEWAILDCSTGVAHTDFQVEEHEPRDENDE
jgi:hypothetical protein